MERSGADRALGITVHTIKGYGDTAVAEHTMALMMARRGRGLARAWTATCAPASGSRSKACSSYGKTLGLIGLGGIGAEVARIAQAAWA